MNKIAAEKDTDQPDNAETLLPSKTQLKREAHQLVQLGQDILKLKHEEIESLNLPDELAVAIDTALKIKSNAGLKRQRLYIGKLLRHLDHEAIEQQLNKIRHRHDTNTAAFKRLESWRERLIDGDNQVLSEIIERHYDVDRQHIHQLVRKARQEKEREKPPASARKLFRYQQQLEDTKHNS
ncbi:MAG TPA: DUF615 domain-containing protein [Thiotrichales bacterium]|nr:DUF615 domain-containing protein [Thiotrichales bacterium]